MRFLDAEFVKGFIRMANDGWEQGWHERNGGNLSYRVKSEEVESVKENFDPKNGTFLQIAVSHWPQFSSPRIGITMRSPV